MKSVSESNSTVENRRVSIEAESVDGIIQLANQFGNGVGEIPEELHEVVEAIVDAYSGLQEATERRSSGRQRKKVRQYAGREDINSHSFGCILRTLEEFELAVQDGNRWRVADEYKSSG